MHIFLTSFTEPAEISSQSILEHVTSSEITGFLLSAAEGVVEVLLGLEYFQTHPCSSSFLVA